ncbi:ATP-binding cassette domain-containing protein [Nemorincola caseinilytica]|uniref:ATP-binding cassette domain-containing protein n=1 Tax=Nemorincola caseinilytica TaxID=2054315 RepID=A0ABP8N9R2_9BACT
MQLSLHHIVPHHLRERLANQPSDVWGKELVLQGGAVFVQAPSGAGKTTLMHILYGLRTDHDGTLQWDALQPSKTDDATLSRLRATDVSIVFQDLRLFPALTAWENIAVKMHLATAATEQDVLQWMQRLGIYHKKDAPAATLSYGEQQRVAIVRALVQPFKWLLLDEPFSHLDSANRQQAIALVADVVRQRNAGMILADLDENNYFPYQQTLRL